MPEEEEKQKYTQVKKSIKTTVTVTFETNTHKFSIAEDKLEDLEGHFAELQSKIQKGLRQTIEVSNAEWWTESWKSIFKEITGQELLDNF